MTDEKFRQPLALGPDDLAPPPVKPLNYERLQELIVRHLDAHLPVLVDEAVTDAVEPVARELVQRLRTAIVERLAEERSALFSEKFEGRTERFSIGSSAPTGSSRAPSTCISTIGT